MPPRRPQPASVSDRKVRKRCPTATGGRFATFCHQSCNRALAEWPRTADHPQFCIVGIYKRFSLRSQLQKVVVVAARSDDSRAWVGSVAICTIGSPAGPSLIRELQKCHSCRMLISQCCRNRTLEAGYKQSRSCQTRDCAAQESPGDRVPARGFPLSKPVSCHSLPPLCPSP